MESKSTEYLVQRTTKLEAAVVVQFEKVLNLHELLWNYLFVWVPFEVVIQSSSVTLTHSTNESFSWK